jgi:type IX secretion system PorP/SprF family membrane protein
MRKFIYLIITLVILSKQGLAQQRPHFSQYMFSGLVINPAYAGADEALSATFIDRRQWRGLEGAPTTQTLALHALTKRKKVGLGLLVSYDKIGIHSNLSAQLNYAYHLKVSAGGILSFGLQGGIMHLKADYASLVTPRSPDPKLTNYFLNEVYASFGTGIFYRTKNWQIGFSLPELLPHANAINDTTSVSFKTINAFAFIRYRAQLNPDWTLEPALLVKRYGQLPISFESTVATTYKQVLTIGGMYRLQESIGLLLRAKFTPQLNGGYSYDYPIRSAINSNAVSHEVMLQYKFSFDKSGVKSPRL